MMIEKFPLLEYDASQEAVVMPNHEKLNIQLPKVAVFACVRLRLAPHPQLKLWTGSLLMV